MNGLDPLHKPFVAHTQKRSIFNIPGCFSGFVEIEACSVFLKKGKALLAVLLGTIVERYDYALYGYMAAFLSSRFFPDEDPTVSLLKHFLVLSLGYLTKPFGAYIFGCMGDIEGRKKALRWSIVGIAFPTMLMGCLPSYAEIGWLATAILVLCRMIQSVFISAESDGVDIFIYETMPKNRACLANSLSWTGVTLGNSLAAFLGGAMILPWMPSWAWRVPFFLGGLLGLLTLWLRRHLIESYDYILFKANQPKRETEAFTSVLWQQRKPMMLSFVLIGAMGAIANCYMLFWNTYLHTMLNIISAKEASIRPFLLMLTYTIMAPICGAIADRFKLLAAVKFSLVACLMLIGLNIVALSYNMAPLWLMVCTVVGLVFFNIPANVMTVKIFPIDKRYRGMSMAHALAAVVLSSTSPAVCTFLWQRFHYPPAPLYYCSLLLSMALVTTLFIRPKAVNALVPELEPISVTADNSEPSLAL